MSIYSEADREALIGFYGDERGLVFHHFLVDGKGVEGNDCILKPEFYHGNTTKEFEDFIKGLYAYHQSLSPAKFEAIVSRFDELSPSLKEFISYVIPYNPAGLKVEGANFKAKMHPEATGLYTIGGTYAKSDRFRTLNCRKVVLETMKLIKDEKVEKIDDDEMVEPTDNIWRRDSKNNLRRGDDGPSEEEYAADSIMYKHLRCKRAGVKEDKNCDNLWRVLIDRGSQVKDNAEMQKVFEDVTPEVMKNDVANMDPKIAMDLLKNLGFKQCTAFDSTANMNLRKVCSVRQWCEEVLTQKYGFDQKTVDENRNKNKKLFSYLEYVVAFINSNPAILNKDYHGPTDEGRGIRRPRSAYAEKLGIQQKFTEPKKRYYDLSLLYQQAAQRRVPLVKYDRLLGGLNTPFGDTILPTYFGGVQAGGSMVTRYVLSPHVGSQILKNMFSNLKLELESHNKKLSSNTENNASNAINSMKISEETLLKTLKYMENYAKYLKVFKNYDHEVVDESKLKQLTDSYNNMLLKYNNIEKSLLKVMMDISKEVEKDENVVGDL
jgi:hypothetical protein